MPSLQNRIEASEITRSNLIQRVRALNPEKQSHRANPGDFSAIEMLEHMALVEALNASFIESTVAAGLIKKPARPNFIYKFVIKGMKRGKRVPTDKQFIPHEAVTLESAISKWDIARNQIIQHIQDNPEHPTAIKHKYFGRLSAFQLLDLLDSHCEYHDFFFPVK